VVGKVGASRASKSWPGKIGAESRPGKIGARPVVWEVGASWACKSCPANIGANCRKESRVKREHGDRGGILRSF
jgi:hypothetical protein